jgi:hypothetical protein
MREHLVTFGSNLKDGIYYILKIDFSLEGYELDPLLLSTKERDTSIGKTYGYVESFQNMDSTIRVGGYGTSQEIKVVINDVTGLFFDVYSYGAHFNDRVCSLYVGEGFDTYKIAELSIDNITYNYNEKQMVLSLISPDKDNDIGYETDFESIIFSDDFDQYAAKDLYKLESIPEVFGHVEKMPIQKMFENLIFYVKEDVIISNKAGPFEVIVEGDLLQYITDFTNFNPFLLVGVDEGAYILKIDNAAITILSDTEIKITIDREDATNTFYENIAVEVIDTGDYDYETGVATFYLRITDENYPWLQYTYLDTHHDLGEIEGGMWPAGSLRRTLYVKDQKNDILTVSTAHKHNNILNIERVKLAPGSCRKIAEGTKIIPYKFWNKNEIYPVDLKEDSTVLTVFNKLDETYVEVPSSQYTVYHTNGDDADKIFNSEDEPLACTYLKFDDLNFIRYRLVDDSSDSGSLLQSEPYVTISNNYNTIGSAVNYLTNKYSKFNTIVPDNIKDYRVDFALLEREKLYDIITDITWQSNMAIRETVIGGSENFQYVAEILPLKKMSGEDVVSVFSFNSSNIIDGSLEFSFTPREDINTIFEIVKQLPDYSLDLVENVKVKNRKYFGKNIYGIDYYVWNPDESINESNIDFWIDRLSTAWSVITLETDIKTLHLEIWDYVNITLPPNKYYRVDRFGSHRTHLDKLSEAKELSFNGRITNIKTDLYSGKIRYVIRTETPIKMQES